RDPESTTYTGAIESAGQFGKRLYLEAWNRGWGRAKAKVVIGDGAEWIWNIANQHFPGAIQIVDLYHARQRLWEVARMLYPGDAKHQNRWIGVHQKRWLDKGKIDKLVASLRSISASAPAPDSVKAFSSAADYFENNATRMNYPEFRSRHLFVGSGIVEAGCKTVIGYRFKQSGMFWSVTGANSILALRCCFLNGRFEDYWEARRAA
ncbi:MAG: transposase, partial [Bryobacterales bacterium]|nr:transposase [Bryobacterales bacterium]